MDTSDPRPDLTAAQRIAIALGTAPVPPPAEPAAPVEAADGAETPPA